MIAIEIREPGGPEVLALAEAPLPYRWSDRYTLHLPRFVPGGRQLRWAVGAYDAAIAGWASGDVWSESTATRCTTVRNTTCSVDIPLEGVRGGRTMSESALMGEPRDAEPGDGGATQQRSEREPQVEGHRRQRVGSREKVHREQARQDRGPGILPVSAQSIVARHRLGEHGAFARDSGPVG